MEEMSKFAYRKSTRMPKFDYSSVNYYFVTICTHEKNCIFGLPNALNPMGEIASEEMSAIDRHYTGIHVDKFVVMPNHVHAIIVISQPDGITGTSTLNRIVGSYKSGVSRKIRELVPGMTVWQRSFHDHVIRGQDDYEKIWNYIQFNPQKWEDDCFYPANRKP